LMSAANTTGALAINLAGFSFFTAIQKNQVAFLEPK